MPTTTIKVASMKSNHRSTERSLRPLESSAKRIIHYPNSAKVPILFELRATQQHSKNPQWVETAHQHEFRSVPEIAKDCLNCRIFLDAGNFCHFGIPGKFPNPRPAVLRLPL